MAATTHVINWKANASANKPPLTVVTDPESIYTGDKIKISLYSAYQHTLTSPYNGASAKSIDSKNDPITEIIELSGNNEINAKFPIKELITLVVVMPLVDELTQQIVDSTGLVQVVNQQLKVSDKYKLHGAIKLVYRTFNAQVWQHRPFTSPGRALLFARNDALATIENVSLSIGEKSGGSGESLRIESYPTEQLDVTPYAHFILYPASANVVMKVDHGKVKRLRTESKTIKAESISFSGKEASASYKIDALESFEGYWFDGDGNEISPDFRVSEGKIFASKDCWGMGFVSYRTAGSVYSYDAEVTTINIPGGGIHTDLKIGTVYAFLKGRKGIGTSYNIPVVDLTISKPVDFCTVYKEIVVDNNGAWEKPDNFSGNESTQVQQYVVASGYYYSNGLTDVSTYGEENLGVYKGQPFSGKKYMLNKTIPSDVNAYTKSAIEQKIADLAAKYGATNA